MSTVNAIKSPSKPEAGDPQKVREAAGLSVEEMAELMGMSLQGYQSWERGLRRPGEPAHRLLRLIDNDIEAVRGVLQ